MAFDAVASALGPAVLGIVVLAIALFALWYMCTSDPGEPDVEAFSTLEKDVIERSLGDSAPRLLHRADKSKPGTAVVTDSVMYLPFEAPFRLVVTDVGRNTIEIASADAMVAKGAFVCEYFRLAPTDRDVFRAKTSGGISVFKVEPSRRGDSQTFAIEYIQQKSPLDISLYSKAWTPPIKFRGYRASIDADLHRLKVTNDSRFSTPELLKREVLAGVTIVVPKAFDRAVVAFRRFREDSGFIMFGVDRTDTEVIVKHVVFKRGRPPVDLDLAARAMEWNEIGEFDSDAPFHAVPDREGGIARAGAINVEELKRAMDVAVSLKVPMRRSRRDTTIVEVTPGIVRVLGNTAHPFVECRVVKADPFMKSDRSRWTSDPSRPLQMCARNAIALPMPVGDLDHLATMMKSL